MVLLGCLLLRKVNRKFPRAPPPKPDLAVIYANFFREPLITTTTPINTPMGNGLDTHTLFERKVCHVTTMKLKDAMPGDFQLREVILMNNTLRLAGQTTKTNLKPLKRSCRRFVLKNYIQLPTSPLVEETWSGMDAAMHKEAKRRDFTSLLKRVSVVFKKKGKKTAIIPIKVTNNAAKKFTRGATEIITADAPTTTKQRTITRMINTKPRIIKIKKKADNTANAATSTVSAAEAGEAGIPSRSQSDQTGPQEIGDGVTYILSAEGTV
ncbi:hypothetical protein Pmani_031342 [Petrolisthes manimaculis]|uniref:Uncharacterized protein n=1 Tax=Petrolisthes manimaculis TaxID=1843537 RepID=A0AAE1NTX9_9EUCA|nr:hypothetical protein Pmani_031342 [Petrolisthes manimaculis]